MILRSSAVGGAWLCARARNSVKRARRAPIAKSATALPSVGRKASCSVIAISSRLICSRSSLTLLQHCAHAAHAARHSFLFANAETTQFAGVRYVWPTTHLFGEVTDGVHFHCIAVLLAKERQRARLQRLIERHHIHRHR